ncbi:MAG: dihydrofolate reductase [Treponema sp.]|nr:dihydrofolate reductase [Treponema sp.]
MISLIVAFAKNNVIGKDGKIPWNIEGEQSRFKELTTNNIVIMGRKTFEEIYQKLQKPLPNRINIVISKTKKYDFENCFTFDSLDAALDFCKKTFPQKDIFISGGAALYQKALTIVEKMYITEIDLEVPSDTFFPKFSEENFICEEEIPVKSNVDFVYKTYRRR